VNPVVRPIFTAELSQGQIALVTGIGAGIGCCLSIPLDHLDTVTDRTICREGHFEAARHALRAEGFDLP
jgi:hypothetical protein